MESEKQAFYKQDWFTIAMLVVFAPVGMFLMWRYRKFNKMVRAIVTTFFSITLAISLLMGVLFGVAVMKIAKTPGGEGGFYANEVSDTEEPVIEEDVEEPTEENLSEESNGISDGKATMDSDEGDITPDGKSMGQTFALSNSSVTLNAVRKDTDGGLFGINNDFYLLVDVTVENTSDEEQTIESVVNFLMEDSAGNLSVPSATYQDTTGSLTGVVAPGETLQGELAFDVQESANYSMTYTDHLGGGEAVWTFSAE